ncbi:serine dehydratase alpha subunit [Sinorhizobium medicae]|nr:serine dehydratase alpha subunit [Sinorhizobium medicae]
MQNAAMRSMGVSSRQADARHVTRAGLLIAQMKRAKLTRTSAEALDDGLDSIWDAMNGCIDRGLKVDGIMPGGLKVKRRARHPWPPQ